MPVGLANRRPLSDDLTRRSPFLRQWWPSLAVHCIDVDHFPTSTTPWLAAGDLLLKIVAIG